MPLPRDAGRRAHFHEFMAGIHAFLHEWRSGKRKDAPQDDDPAAAAAESIARNTALLCFDEFSVTDIADAMILGRLFAALFARGIVIVATTNVRPDLLYKDGINRALFLPFVAMIEEKMEILRLDARTDFRLEKLAAQTVYFTPADETARTALTRAFKSLTGAEQGSPVRLRVLERELTIGEALDHAARSTFAELCENPLGPADFLAVAQNFHTVFVDAIPVIPAERRDVAKRDRCSL